MPVEVRELIIKAVVDDQIKIEESKEVLPKQDHEDIVGDCVEQVLEILKREKER